MNIYIYIYREDLDTLVFAPNNSFATKIKKLDGTHGAKLNFNKNKN